MYTISKSADYLKLLNLPKTIPNKILNGKFYVFYTNYVCILVFKKNLNILLKMLLTDSVSIDDIWLIILGQLN